ncbi:hypothetical protein [Enhygromyxa salina]|nr:hypothetical protein [Enhygromyxa salina]
MSSANRIVAFLRREFCYQLDALADLTEDQLEALAQFLVSLRVQESPDED